MEKSRTDNADGGMVYPQLSVIMPVYKDAGSFFGARSSVGFGRDGASIRGDFN